MLIYVSFKALGPSLIWGAANLRAAYSSLSCLLLLHLFSGIVDLQENGSPRESFLDSLPKMLSTCEGFTSFVVEQKHFFQIISGR